MGGAAFTLSLCGIPVPVFLCLFAVPIIIITIVILTTIQEEEREEEEEEGKRSTDQEEEERPPLYFTNLDFISVHLNVT